MRIRSIEAKNKYLLELTFEDGQRGTVDVGDLAGRGVFACWEQPGAFERVAIGSGGEAVWDCGVDLCADMLYLRLTDARPANVLPGLEDEPRCA